MKEIQLTQGYVALVDDKDFEELSKFKWHVFRTGKSLYAARNTPYKDGKRRVVKMHRQILGVFDSSIQIDHKDRSGLNNQRENLRVCSLSENRRNIDAPSNNTSGFKGVSLHKKTGKFRSRIDVGKKQIHLGLFTCPVEAAKAYNQAALVFHGEFACLNAL